MSQPIRAAIEAIVPDSSIDERLMGSFSDYRQRVISALCDGAVELKGSYCDGIRQWAMRSNSEEFSPPHECIAIMLKPQPINQAVSKAEIVEMLRVNDNLHSKKLSEMADRIEKYGVRE